MKNDLNFNISAPWVIYCREIESLFKEDPDISVFCDEFAKKVTICVQNSGKADAIRKLLPEEKRFGSVTLKICVESSCKEESRLDIFKKAFEGNPIYNGVITIGGEDSPMPKINYVVFNREVVQYFADNFHDPNGLVTTIYQDIANDVFGESAGVYFCTDNK